MKISSPEEYIKHLKKQSKEYQWPLENYAKNKLKAKDANCEFPHTIIFEGHYDDFDYLEDKCRNLLGDKHGECNWNECEFSYFRWHRESGLEKEMNTLLYEELDRSKRPKEGTKEREVWDDYTNMVIHEHFEIIKNEDLGQPGKHCHKGVWTTIWLMKTGYDYGFQEFKFRHINDFVLFCLTCL